MAQSTDNIKASITLEKQEKQHLKRMLLAVSCVSILLFFAVWYMAVSQEWVNPKYVSSPVEVFKTFIYKLTNKNPDGSILSVHIWSSLKLALTGYFVALIVGIPAGLAMGYFKTIDNLVTPIFEIIRPIPPIAWIPLVTMWLGLGTTAKGFIIFLSAVIPCVINSYTGVKMTKPVLINVAKTCGASNWTIFTSVCVPAAMPMVFVGMRVSIGNAWTTLVGAELLAATSGLGYMIQLGRTVVRPDIIMVGMITIGVIGAFLYGLLGLIESRALRWRARR